MLSETRPSKVGKWTEPALRVLRERYLAEPVHDSPLAHSHQGTGSLLSLLVTWASLPAAYRGGVERYLATALTPLVGSTFPDVLPIEVNLPGQS